MQKTKEKKENVFKRIWNYYTVYEKCWFLSITVLAFVFAFLFPEEDIGGVNGKVIMALYLIDIFSNILCELLISKQGKWNFLVSLVVEAVEFAICIVCSYRFATIATTIFFWIPIDIISFVMWNKHKDKNDENLTVVRKLKGWQEVLVIAGIVVWTVVIGYLLSLIDVEEGILSDNPLMEKVVCYLDACCSAVGIANGLFILFRYREQWIAWYISTFIEIAINIISGQWVLLVLKAVYLTNTTYGYIKWTKYINSNTNKNTDENGNELKNKPESKKVLAFANNESGLVEEANLVDKNNVKTEKAKIKNEKTKLKSEDKNKKNE